MRFFRNVSYLTLLILLASCLAERPKGKFVVTGFVSGGSQSQQVFARTVYPILRENCKNCHGEEQAPLHAQEDAKLAHDEVIKTGKVDFNIAGNSRLVLKVKEGHNFWSEAEADGELLRNAIEKWLPVIDKSLVNPDGTKTETVDIASGLDVSIPGDPTADPLSPEFNDRTIRRVTFDVAVSGTNVQFSVDVEDVPLQPYYRVFSLSMTNGSKHMIVKKASAFINETVDLNATAFHAISDVIPSGQAKDLTGGPNGTVLFLRKENGLAEDQIQFNFEVLHPYDEI